MQYTVGNVGEARKRNTKSRVEDLDQDTEKRHGEKRNFSEHFSATPCKGALAGA